MPLVAIRSATTVGSTRPGVQRLVYSVRHFHLLNIQIASSFEQTSEPNAVAPRGELSLMMLALQRVGVMGFLMPDTRQKPSFEADRALTA